MPLHFIHGPGQLVGGLRAISEKVGAQLSFYGRVRGLNRGREVSYLLYEADERLAQKMFMKLEGEAKARFSIAEVNALHRMGRVEVSEDAVLIEVLAEHRDEAYRASRFLIDELKRQLPIWKKEVYADASYDWGHSCNANTSSMFQPVAKALAARGVAIDELNNKSVLLIGAGGLGCPMAINLAALGLRSITLYDGDVVSSSNLARQYIYQNSDIGQNKTRIVKRFIEDRFFSCQVDARTTFFDDNEFDKVASPFNLIVDSSDRSNIKAMLKAKCYMHKKPLVTLNVHRLDGDVQVYLPDIDNGCLSCFRNSFHEQVETCQGLGVLTHVCAMVASVAAEKALTVLSEQQLTSELIIVDPMASSLKRIELIKDPFCGVCGAQAGARKNRLVGLSR